MEVEPTPSQDTSVTGEITGEGELPQAPGASVDDLSPGTCVGRYIILGRLGAGAMGVVYAAFDPELDRKIALKLLNSGGSARLDARARLLREAKSLARLSHPNVVGVHDVGTYGDHIFLAMEFVPGRTLTAWLKEQPRRWPQVLEVMRCAGEGLAAAHAAGLVHRDFKPDNILIGDDGRARVLDFGLARASGEAPENLSNDSEALAAIASASTSGAHRSRAHAAELALVTRTGALIGTPAYMSPEQHLGRPADALSDQFSFSIALYQALYGVRPFSGARLSSLAYQIMKGKVEAPPAGSQVPGWLRKVVVRGLALDAEDRWPSMRAMLTALARERGLGRPGAWLLGGLAGLGFGLALWLTRDPAVSPCQGSAQRLAGIWDAARVAEIQQAFLASGAPYAADAWQSVDKALSAYAQRWVAAHHDACAATHIYGEQSERILDLRTRCLNRHLGRFKALSDGLARAGAGTIEHAPEAASLLGDLSTCADAEALDSVVPAPEDPAKVADVEARLADAGAQELAGDYTRAFELALLAVNEATALAYAPLEAEALRVRARIQRRLARHDMSAESLTAAIAAAARGRDDHTAATAWTDLVYHVGTHKPDAVRLDAHRLAAEAAIVRAGDDASLRARLDLGVANGLRLLGRYDEALAPAQRALALYERDDPGNAHNLADALHSLALIHQRRNHVADAQRAFDRAIAAHERAYGRAHPVTASVLSHAAVLALEQGDLDRADALAREAHDVRQRSLPRGNVALAESARILAEIAALRGDLDGAQARYDEALAIYRDQPDVDAMHRATLHNDLAILADQRGDLPGARQHYRDALELYRQRFGFEHVYARIVERNLVEVALWLGDPAAALTLADRLIASAPREPPIEPPVPYVLALRAQALLALGRDAEAREAAERAVADLDAHLGGAPDAEEAAIVRATLARVLPTGGDDGKRRLALMLLAEPELRRAAEAKKTAAARALAAVHDLASPPSRP
ncbi:serine/threonine-protein kinase [Nannocystis bainbridge]|uniref:Tetratricopeptide repeat protein n=1 Tax=Nannocystis bainbridge TaxID=2995303 RepID=A0ABT5DQC0_9BACT|nr:serine/threonine-protein kinase [Nannocystis bainbridge]MDC0715746.1 tetratricopeptide repeat protein [Nannocystis bainbridge]